MPKYSIITVALNGILNTIRCVESVFECTEDFELIVVDSNTDDGTEQWLDHQIKLRPNLRTIRSNRNLSFAENNNLGIQIVQKDSQYIVFLNNDTKVSDKWLERMEAHFKNIEILNIGAIGPVCNSSNGRQMVGPQNPAEWYERYKGNWKHTGCLYGWCIMVKKPIIDAIGGFDERFLNAWEDNDLSLRVQLAGYQLAIAYDVYIHHEGQGTLGKVLTQDQYIKNGMEMREEFFDKYSDKAKKKLVAVYRTNYGPWLERSLEKTSKFADHIILHFCRAPEFFDTRIGMIDRETKMWELVQRFPKIVKYQFYDGIFQEDYERGWLLEQALGLQVVGEADWCISIDDDELYEDKFAHRVQAMMNPRDPQVLGYWCNWRTIWDTQLGVEYYRTDSTFGQFANYRFFRLIPGQKIISRHPEGHHCGSAPWLADENLRWTNIRVKHMGYDTPEQRQRKFDFYQKNDNFKNKADIGFDDYSHLIDLNPALNRWVANHGISLNVMVKNDEEWIEGMLENVQWLVDEMVIVDTGSTDRTRIICEQFALHSPIPVKILDYPWVDNYSLPRNFAKLNSTHPWIMFMDADERFYPQFIRDIWAASEGDYNVILFNVVNYLEQPHPTRSVKATPTQAARLFRNIPDFYFTGIIHETIDDSTVAFQMHEKLKGIVCGAQLHHYGYLKNKKIIKGKLDYYEQLNEKQLEITDGKDPRAYFNLALHYMGTDQQQKALENFQKCLNIAPAMWHASQQMALLNLRNSKNFLGQALGYMPESHPSRPKMVELMKFLNAECQDIPKVC